MKTKDTLVFFQTPTVTMATNSFTNVPIILQYDDTPLVIVIKKVMTKNRSGFTLEIPIYHPDGTYLAKAVGSRLFTTNKGEKAGLLLKYPQNMTVCEMEGKTLFEISRNAAAAVSVSAELYTPNGVFVRCPSNLPPDIFRDDKWLNIGSAMLRGNKFFGGRIGILIKSDGSILLSVS